MGCGPSGLVDRAVSLETGARLALPFAAKSPALADGVVYDPTGGLARLADGAAAVETSAVTIRVQTVAPPATDGERVALLTADRVEMGACDSRVRKTVDARPAGWYPPAIAGSWVAWVEDGGETGEDVLGVDTTRGTTPVALAGGPGHQRHVVGSGPWLAWVEDDAVVMLNTPAGERTRIPASAGFSAPPSLWGEVLCYEERSAGDVDITCTDGLRAGGPGDQQSPSRFGPWLLYRQRGQVWLLTAP